MNADETVKALRRIREVRIFGNDQTQLMADAADLIESLQAQLAESQRREQAAVEDIMCRDHCDVCVSGKELDNECENADYDCQTCKSATCRCRECRNEDKWQWRGPQEAEEGERDG